MADGEPRVTIRTVDTRLAVVEYKIDRLYWGVNGLLAIVATGVVGAAVTWMISGGLVRFEPPAQRERAAIISSQSSDLLIGSNHQNSP